MTSTDIPEGVLETPAKSSQIIISLVVKESKDLNANFNRLEATNLINIGVSVARAIKWMRNEPGYNRSRGGGMMKPIIILLEIV